MFNTYNPVIFRVAKLVLTKTVFSATTATLVGDLAAGVFAKTGKLDTNLLIYMDAIGHPQFPRIGQNPRLGLVTIPTTMLVCSKGSIRLVVFLERLT